MNLRALNAGFFVRGAAALMIAVLLTLTLGAPVRAQTDKDLQATEKIKAKVRDYGVSDKKRVEVKLRNKAKFTGTISSIGADAFTVSDAKSGTAQTFAYTDVADVRKKGGISPLTWGIIAGAAAAAVIVGVTVLYPVLCDGGAGC